MGTFLNPRCHQKPQENQHLETTLFEDFPKMTKIVFLESHYLTWKFPISPFWAGSLLRPTDVLKSYRCCPRTRHTDANDEDPQDDPDSTHWLAYAPVATLTMTVGRL